MVKGKQMKTLLTTLITFAVFAPNVAMAGSDCVTRKSGSRGNSTNTSCD